MEKEAFAFLAFEEDIKNRSFKDWLKAHTSLPPKTKNGLKY
jgi:hypothetical protein